MSTGITGILTGTQCSHCAPSRAFGLSTADALFTALESICIPDFQKNKALILNLKAQVKMNTTNKRKKSGGHEQCSNCRTRGNNASGHTADFCGFLGGKFYDATNILAGKQRACEAKQAAKTAARHANAPQVAAYAAQIQAIGAGQAAVVDLVEACGNLPEDTTNTLCLI